MRAAHQFLPQSYGCLLDLLLDLGTDQLGHCSADTTMSVRALRALGCLRCSFVAVHVLRGMVAGIVSGWVWNGLQM